MVNTLEVTNCSNDLVITSQRGIEVSRAKALILASIPAIALFLGIFAAALSRINIAYLIFLAGIIPVLTALLIKIILSLSRREFGLDIIAALSMSGALIAHEALAGAVIALMYSGGQLLEDYAQGRAQREMTALLGRVAHTAQVYRNTILVDTPIELILPDDRLFIRAGEVIPVNGRINSAVALIDESSLTGEPLPVYRTFNEIVSSGVSNAGKPFDLYVTHTAANSTYAAVVRLVDTARYSKAPIARLADKYALGFLAVTIMLAGAVWILTGDITRVVSVLVIATPCPLILAVPVAIVAGMSRAAKHGLLFKSARTLEILPHIRNLLIDKTGTVTDGYPQVLSVKPYDGITSQSLIYMAASLAQASQHSISKALVAKAKTLDITLTTPTRVDEVAGDGVKGWVKNRNIMIGHPNFITQNTHQTQPPESNHPAGATVLDVAIDGTLAGRIIFNDKLRDDATKTISSLRKAGVRKITLITGDQSIVAKEIGKNLGVDKIIAQATPEQKINAVKIAKAQGLTMMVGDGINDAPALTEADIGVPMGANEAAAAAEAADIVLLVDRIGGLIDAIEIARHTLKIALQSVIVGLSLSFLGMISAAFGYLPPIAGALAQEAIDVAVVLNALRALGGDFTNKAIAI
jgi:heavy metal translocating P-type ATPase